MALLPMPEAISYVYFLNLASSICRPCEPVCGSTRNPNLSNDSALSTIPRSDAVLEATQAFPGSYHLHCFSSFYNKIPNCSWWKVYTYSERLLRAVIRNRQPVPASWKVLQLFYNYIFHHHIFQGKFRYDFFVLRKFLFKFFHLLELLNIQTAIFALPFIKCRLADTVFPANLIHCFTLILLR